MTNFKESAAPEGDARARLASIVAERAEIAARIREIDAAEARLLSTASPDAEAERELAALDAAASRELAEWARSGAEGEPPNPDSAKREELFQRASKAQARARAVEGARADLNAERNAEARKLAALESRIDPAVLDVLTDEVTPVADEFKRLAAAAGELAWRVVSFKATAIEMAHAAKEEARGEFFARLPAIVDRLEGILPPPSLDGSEGLPHRASWLALAARLRGGDVAAKLELGA